MGTNAAAVWIVFSAAALLFLVVAIAVATSFESVAAFDGDVAVRLHMRAEPAIMDAMVVVSFLGAPTTLTVIVVAGSFLLVHRRKYAEAAILLSVVLGGNLLNFCLKLLIERGRPVFDDPLFSLPSYSFPSGHAMASTVFYGLLATFAAVNVGRHYASAAIAAAVSMVALVCFSRVYLGLHYVSDVIGGIFEGVAWLALSIAVSRHIRHKNAGVAVDV